MKKYNRYEWHGQKVKTQFGYCKVTENIDKPMYWYNFECNNSNSNYNFKTTFIPAIKITYEDQIFCIANHFGIGVHKLINGGWPSHTHFSLNVNDFTDDLTIPEKQLYCIRQFDLDKYSEHEANRRKLQKQNYPEQFEQFEKLRRGN